MNELITHDLTTHTCVCKVIWQLTHACKGGHVNELTAYPIASERSMCVHAQVHTCILVHACMCEGQRKTSAALLYILYLVPFKHSLLLNLEPTGPGDPISIPTSSFGVIGIHGHSWLFSF